MPRIEIKDLNEEITISEAEIKHVKGGLLPTFGSVHDKSSPLLFGENYPKLGVNLDQSANKFLK